MRVRKVFCFCKIMHSAYCGGSLNLQQAPGSSLPYIRFI
ncbi:MAG: hypothetical protein RHS_3162 [Robinsoniella sp. RHS]|nr:MAG: hypothetical protein RHS_3162 [Robinsoniella sp. RHS]